MIIEISPLFAVEAEQMLLAGFPEEAVELCKEGLEIYPDYPSAIAILAKASELAGFRSEAKSIINSAKDNFYSRTIENITNQVNDWIDSPVYSENISEDVDEESIFESQSDYFIKNDFENPIIENKFNDTSYEKIEDLISEHEFVSISDEKRELIDSEIISEFNNLKISSELEDIFEENEIKIEPEILPESTEFSVTNLDDFETVQNEMISEPEFADENKIIDNNNIIPENTFVFKKFPQNTVRIDEISVKDKNLNINELISTHINIRLRNSNISESLFKPAKAKVVVTETMADILSKQGSTQQAIDIYLKLAKIEPEKYLYFNQKISQIRNNF